MIDLKLFKIRISSEGFRCDVCRYGIESDEIIKRLREEFIRYNDKRANYKMEAEELDQMVRIKVKG